MKKINLSTVATERDSLYNNLEQMPVWEITHNINKEDQTVALAVAEALPQVNKLIEQVVEAFKKGGRLFYIGAGTSGRLGVVDASECPPTFGVPHDMVIGLIAGGDGAIRCSIEGAEDSLTLGFSDLKSHNVTKKDIVIGIAASGRTPYVLGALRECRKKGIKTGCIVCSSKSPISLESDFPVEVLVGPEFLTGSTRMKSGTAQKLVCNMITTASMVLIGKVTGNKMTHMRLSNEKLKERGLATLMEKTGLTRAKAITLLKSCNYNLPEAIQKAKKK